MSDHVSDLRWDRMLAGDLPSDEANAARAHAAECERCAARLRDLMSGLDAFKAMPTPLALAPRRKRGVWIGAAGALAAAAAIVIVVTRPREPEERRKGAGDPELLLEVGRGAQHIALSSRDLVFPGDVLQAGYTSARDGFGAVLARDGANEVFAYVPSVGDQMLALPAGERKPFPQSTTLDAVVGQERIFVVWCAEPYPIPALLAELRKTGDVGARETCHVRRIELTKQAP